MSNALKDQIKTLKDTNSRLQAQPSHGRVQRTSNRDEGNEEDADEEESSRDEVVILHDSLCKRVNNSLLSRENVRVKKVWAPDLVAMEDALDRVDAKVVVIEALTRDLATMETGEMKQKIAGIVNKASTKADKVVLSTIVRREDIEDIDLKADLVNAQMKLEYKQNNSVVICDNYKLHDSKFRIGDKLHLSDDGVPIFASNLKYAIADALGIRVQRKRNRRPSYQNWRRDERNEYENLYDR